MFSKKLDPGWKNVKKKEEKTKWPNVDLSLKLGKKSLTESFSKSSIRISLNWLELNEEEILASMSSAGFYEIY